MTGLAGKAQPFLRDTAEVGFGHRWIGAEAGLLHALEILLEFLLLGFAEVHERARPQTAEQRDDGKAVHLVRHFENIARMLRPDFWSGPAVCEDEEEAAAEECDRGANTQPKRKT